MGLQRLLALFACLFVCAGAAPHPFAASATAKPRTKSAKPPATSGCTSKASKKNQRSRDVDKDGLPNLVDPDIDGDRKANGADKDLDGDKLPNPRDAEMDADAIPNALDRDIDSDRRGNLQDPDMDADGAKNTRDRDMDGDGIANKVDLDIDADCLANTADGDIDGDGIEDFEDLDSDSSGDSVAATPNTTRARVPRSFFGVVSEDIFWASPAGRQSLLDEVQGMGAGTIRQTFDWSLVELAPGLYDWTKYDLWMADLARRGIDVLPTLFNPPAFRSSAPPVPERGTYPPRSNDEFAEFALQVVRRYGPGGSFWDSRPDLPRRPLRSYQIWNEPNLKSFWPTGSNPEAYVAMLRTVGSAIRSADPGAEVVAAGLPESPNNMPVKEFVRRMYRAGAKGAFNTIAVHPYSSSADRSFDIVYNLRKLMDAHGDAASRIWVSEIGWADKGPAAQFTVGARGQYEMVRRVFATLVGQSERLKLRGIVYFNWRDAAPHGGRADFWGMHTGLYEIGGKPKPALEGYSSTVRTLIAR